MLSNDTSMTFTYQARIQVDESTFQQLQDFASLLSKVERFLFAEISAGKKASELKSDYIKRFGITARHFNAIRVQLEGKMSAIAELRKEQIKQLENRIDSLKKHLQMLEKKYSSGNILHQKKRLHFNLGNKLQRLKMDQEEGKISLCFGSKKLFNAQFHLKDNGYNRHEEWYSDWCKIRDCSFFLIGSKDESSGNQSCSATLAQDGSLSLRIRVPDSLISNGKYIVLQGVNFKYGYDKILEALKSCEDRKGLQRAKDPNTSKYGVPISYRFKCDEKGWRVFVSLPVEKPLISTTDSKGVIGVDINANHLAIAETDQKGNVVTKKTIPLNTYGKSKYQAKALTGDVCAELVKYAKHRGKPLVIEKLDFQKKKAALKEEKGPRYSRMLSSLAYSNIKSNLKSRAWREGVGFAEVNPAYTSLIGRIKFSKRYGLSIHHAAALVIGRRYLKASERVPRRLDEIPDGKGGYVALSVPVRNRDKHVWSTWGIINRELKTVHAAHFRANRIRSKNSKPVVKTKNIPDFDGGIPSRESSAKLFSWRA